jgi:hypothetical protein
LFQEGDLAGIAEGFDRGQAEVGGEFAQLGLEARERFEGANDMALEDMPEGDAEFARHRHGGFVATAPRRYGQAPLLQRVLDLEEFLGRLDEQRAQGAAAMTLQGAAAFVVWYSPEEVDAASAVDCGLV